MFKFNSLTTPCFIKKLDPLLYHHIFALSATNCMKIFRSTLHYITKLFNSGLSKSNIKDHYGDVVITQCLGKTAEINEFSASDKML